MENKTSKYFKYAIGEIILVMIGILLALQVNAWNTKRLLKSKEQVYLKQIRISLNNDLEIIKDVKEFNAKKAYYIDSTFMVLEQSSNPEKYVPLITDYLFVMGEFNVFEPNNIAFENMIASENIDLITNMELRKNLSLYYKRDFVNSTQERIKEQTRQFVDYITPKITNRQFAKQFIKYDSHLPDISETKIHSDQQIYAHLLIMILNMDNHNELLDTTTEEIKRLLDLIDINLKS
ncbi:hypothetical protein MTsPCn9_11390 [Croceitalea sp. MTPC9]|uniref:hypothetical protein n=1 Tax=unclassified Croceitalea TaxID=2632280 RepID=UPI002B3C39B4|nr:hypothetical protein MTsPCn6_25850 [Croceitalea sp. MTPC6]GMN16203.1 hypothetical protein MTsPCn9_11390 [Croceitalea sp. MTPC9]